MLSMAFTDSIARRVIIAFPKNLVFYPAHPVNILVPAAGLGILVSLSAAVPTKAETAASSYLAVTVVVTVTVRKDPMMGMTVLPAPVGAGAE